MYRLLVSAGVLGYSVAAQLPFHSSLWYTYCLKIQQYSSFLSDIKGNYCLGYVVV